MRPYPLAPQHPDVSPLLHMPLRRDKAAPTLFKGKYSEVTRFIKHYNRLLEQHHVEDDEDRCEGILEYCSRKVRDFISSLESYQMGDYNTLQEEILKYYDADREESRIRPNDLVEFLQKTNSKPMQTLSQWRKYYREYLARAGFLKGKNRLSKLDYLGYFWYGIPEHVRDIFHEKLSARHPDHDTTDPWPMDDVVKVAETYFTRSRFTDRLLHLPAMGINIDSDASDDSDTDSDSDDSDSDSEYERRRSHKKKKTHKKKTSKSKKASAPAPKILEEERTRKVLAPSDEIEGIIERLNTMSIDDPAYSLLYYRATRTDESGKVAQCIRRRPQQESSRESRPSYQTNSTPSNSYPNNLPLGERNQSSYPSNGGSRSMRCFGCYDTRHMLGECPKMAELIKKGVVTYDPGSRKFDMPDGRRLFRQPNESLIETIERMRNQVRPAVHFATISSKVADTYSQIMEDNESDDDSRSRWKSTLTRAPTFTVITDPDYSDGYESTTYEPEPFSPLPYANDSDTSNEDTDYFSFSAERGTGRKTNQACQDGMRPAYKPIPYKPIQDGSNNADRRTRSSGPLQTADNHEPALNSNRRPSPTPPRRSTPASTPSSSTRNTPAPMPPTNIPTVPEPIPIDVRQVRFNPNADIQMAEPHAPQPEPSSNARESNTVPTVSRDREQTRSGPRQSDLSAQVAPGEIVHQILDTEISIPVRKLLGASKEVSAAFQDIIKPKSTPRPTTTVPNVPSSVTPRILSGTVPSHSSRGRTEEMLIKLDVQC